MAITDTDKLLVNDGSKTESITFSQFKSGTMLNDTDKFLVNDGSKTETVTWVEIQNEIGPSGVIDPPVAVLTPLNGAGTNAGQPYNPLSTAITAVGAGGDAVFATDTIANVRSATASFTAGYRPGFGVGGVSSQPGCNPNTNLPGCFPNCDPATLGHLGGRIYTTQDNAILDFAFFDSDGNPGIPFNESIVIYSFSNRNVNDVKAVFDDGEQVLTYENNKVSTDTNPYTRTGSGRLISASYGGTTGSSMSSGLVAIVVDGYQFTQLDGTAKGGNLAASTVLTFPSATNFDKFEVGDVVQSNPYQDQSFSSNAVTTGNNTGNVGPNGWWGGFPATNQFDGTLTNYSHPNGNGGPVKVTQTFNPPISCISKLEFLGGLTSNSTPDDATISINGGTPVSLTVIAGVEPKATDITEVAFTGLISEIVLDEPTTGAGLLCFGYKVDGSLLIDQSVNNLPKTIITGIDDSNPYLITVDGGSWYGADGSGAADGETKVTKTVTSDASLTFTDDTELANMVGPLSQVDATGAVKTPVSSTIAEVGSLTFSATYTGEFYDGYGGPNAFDLSQDKVPFPAGAATLTQSNANEKSSRSKPNKTCLIAPNENLAIKNSLWVLFQAETDATVVVQGTSSSYTVDNTDYSGPVISAMYRWMEVPTTIGDLVSITLNGSAVGVAGLAQVKVDGVNIIEGIYATTLTLTDDTDLQYFKEGDVVQGSGWNQDQEWSSQVVNSGAGVNQGPISVAFNGTVGPGPADERVAPLSGQSLTLPISGITTDSTVTIVGSVVGVVGNLEINGTPVDMPNAGAPATNTYTSADVPSLANGVTSIKWFYGSGYLYLQGIYINGELLTDQSIVDLTKAIITDIDDSVPLITVSGGDWLGEDGSGDPSGETVVTGPPLAASANDVLYLTGTTLGLGGVTGTWFPGLHAQGAEVTANAPSPDSIQYTSANGNPLTTQFTGTDATLTTRTWTWQVSNAAVGPWTDFATKTDSPGQDGAVPLADRPPLEENKFYQVKVKYDSDNAESVESTFNTFKTGVN